MTKTLAAAALVLTTGVVVGPIARSDPSAAPAEVPPRFSAFSEFQAMSLRDLDSLQVKLTDVGPRRRPIPTIVFTTPTGAIDLEAFRPLGLPVR